MIAGVCKYCRCTMECPCLVGGEPCSWVNQEQMVCTECLPQMSEQELLHANALDHEEAAGHLLPLLVSSVGLSALVGFVQLGLRHPELPPFTRDFGEFFVAQIVEHLLDLQLFSLAELVRRGGDPAHDVLRPAPSPSPIIIP